jgi:hypothetical protein
MKRKLTLHDLLMIAEKAKEFIIAFPHGGKLRGMQRPLTEHQIRTLAFVVAVHATCGDVIEIDIETPDSDSL